MGSLPSAVIVTTRSNVCSIIATTRFHFEWPAIAKILPPLLFFRIVERQEARAAVYGKVHYQLRQLNVVFFE